ncbi:DUF2279 domain-containing protein [Hymenobacter sp. BT507]|uniref:DUF2279 domain-containing protein n=1 Tax=Hymenobacter citatus TaxID=2763506 RepID=A0ABR7MF39_9BACT|nr:DUF2279 domain-containing protein [Hymenobacter citatus]
MAQPVAVPRDTLTAQQKRTRQLVLGTGFVVGYAVSLKLLSDAWYKEYPHSHFHFYDDSHHWKQMDKAGHFWTAFHESRIGVDALRWAGTSEKKAIWLGSLVGLALQTPIEILDGMSEGYGFSNSDMVANAAGAAGVLGQQLAWGEIRVMPKFSFHSTSYPTTRLESLGNSYAGQVLKDYNGQTYWLSTDISRFLPSGTRYPKWLNVAVGYGAAGMVAGDPAQNRALGYRPYRKFYLSPDLNLMNIPTRSGLLRTAFYVLSIVRVPAPALEYNTKRGLVFRPLYY